MLRASLLDALPSRATIVFVLPALFQTLKGNPVQLARVELAFGQMLQRPPLGRAEGEVRSVLHGDDLAGLVAVCSATGWRTSAASSLRDLLCGGLEERPPALRDHDAGVPRRLSAFEHTSPSAMASSQMVRRGQVVRHASMVSRYRLPGPLEPPA